MDEKNDIDFFGLIKETPQYLISYIVGLLLGIITDVATTSAALVSILLSILTGQLIVGFIVFLSCHIIFKMVTSIGSAHIQAARTSSRSVQLLSSTLVQIFGDATTHTTEGK